LPVAGARERDRIVVAVGDLGEMAERGCRVVEEAQRDPAGSELVLGAIVVPARDGGVARDTIGGLGLAEIENLRATSRRSSTTRWCRSSVRGRMEWTGSVGLFRLVGAAEQLDALV
jgi:hypothetical protein